MNTASTKHKYNNILWVSDIPRFLERVKEHAAFEDPEKMAALMNRVTFALSSEEAVKAIQEPTNGVFDLCILNGSFPKATYVESEEQVRAYLEASAAGDLPRLPRAGITSGNAINFYREQLSELEIPTIILTSDIYNLVRDRSESLPFFHKPSETRDNLIHTIGFEQAEGDFHGQVELTPEERALVIGAHLDDKCRLNANIEYKAIDQITQNIYNGRREVGGRREFIETYLS